MEWLLSAVAVDLGFKLAVCFTLFISYLENNEKFIFYWALGWLLFAVSSFCELILKAPILSQSSFIITTLSLVKYFAPAIASIIFIHSLFLIKNVKADKKISLLMALAGASLFWGAFVSGGGFWIVLPASLITGSALICSAFYWKKTVLPVSVSVNNFIFYGFLLNGIYRLTHPFLNFWYTDWTLSLSVIFTIIFAVAFIGGANDFKAKNIASKTLKDTKKLVTLNSIGSINLCNSKASDIFETILEKTAEVLNLEMGVLYLFSEEEKRLIPKSSFNLDLILKDTGLEPVELGQGLIGKAAQIGENKIISDDSLCADIWPEIKEAGIKTSVVLPLKSHSNKIIAVLKLGSYSDRFFELEEIQLIDLLNNKISAAIENVLMCSSAKKTAKELSTLYDINLSIKQGLDMDEMLNEVLKKVVTALNIEIGAIYILNHKNNSLVLRSKTGLSDEFVEAVRSLSLDSGTLTAQAARTKEPVFVEDFSIYPTSTQKAVQKEGLCGYCAVPIISGIGKSMGVLMVTTKKIRRFKNEEVSLLSSISWEIAIAVENARLYEDLEDVYLRSVTVLAEVVDAKDHYTYSHSKYVTAFALKIAREMRFPEKDIENIRRACQLHDIGKISISDYILTKKKRLTNKEWLEIKKHPFKGAAILEPLTFLKEPRGGVIELIKQHHERFDGKGYPQGLKGEEIEKGARILAVADAYHAMISTRPYRKSLTQKKAVQELTKYSGAQFDPEAVEAFLKILNREKKYSDSSKT
ncbi:MAG: HD domain-containing phosphohydrolase [Candidatus Omnitrophota bacterium]